jgi:hypothetical protein
VLRRVIVSIFIWVIAPACTATDIVQKSFEELVLGADLVAVVECTTAGGIVARYRVIESFRGPKGGSEVSLRIAVNYWEPQFPIALVGQRFFVTAYKNSPPNILVSTSSGGPVPLWWRRIPADYETPLFQGVELMPSPGSKEKISIARRQWEGFDAMRKDVVQLASLEGEQRELLLLKARSRNWGPIAGATKVSQVLDALLDNARESRELANYELIVLSQAGLTRTLQYLRALPTNKCPWDKASFDELKQTIEERLHPASSLAAGRETEPAWLAAPSAEALSKLHLSLTRDSDLRAVAILARHEPATVADYLLTWNNPERFWRESDLGYVLGSLFAYYCGQDRALHLKTLLEARDPFVRVAGAVYLCYEDEKAGMLALAGLKDLPGDPGVWAALNLCRRGDLGAVERMLEVFATSGDPNSMADAPHRNLQKRVQVLLSNSARVSGLEPPQITDLEWGRAGERVSERTSSYLVWFRANRDKLKLTDPWLEQLQRQKVD